MRLVLLAAVIAATIAVGACNQQASQTGPSIIGPALTSLSQVAQSTIAVLDGTTWTNGDYWVTKYPNYPAEPPSPKYLQRVVTGPDDPCTLKWAGYETNYIIDHDDNPLTPAWHWCQLDD